MILALGVILSCMAVSIVVYGCLIVSGQADREMEKYFEEKER